MKRKKKIYNMDEYNDKLEKIGGPVALGVVITLLIIIAVALVIKFHSGTDQHPDGSGTESTLDLHIFDGNAASSQPEEHSSQQFPSVSDNDPEESGTGEHATDDYEKETTGGGIVQPTAATPESLISLYNKDFLKAEDYPEITGVIKAYFKAYADCSMSELMSIVDYNGGTPITLDELEQRAQIVEEYQELSCYLIEGMDSSSFVVYAFYNVKFYNIATPAPTLTRFYVVLSDDKTAHIYNGEITAKLNAYLNTVNEYDSIMELRDWVDDALDQACSQDERLEELMKILYGREPAQKAEEQE